MYYVHYKVSYLTLHDTKLEIKIFMNLNIKVYRARSNIQYNIGVYM